MPCRVLVYFWSSLKVVMLLAVLSLGLSGITAAVTRKKNRQAGNLVILPPRYTEYHRKYGSDNTTDFFKEVFSAGKLHSL